MSTAFPDPAPFGSIDEVVDRFAGAGYIAGRRLATTVYLMCTLDKPVLLEGPAGVGKTELAKTLAEVTGRRLLRLQCYEGQDETKALYEWDYGKQLLYIQMLREKIGDVIADAPDLASAVERIDAQDSVFFSDHFLAPRPLLDAVRGEEPAVLLIDEVDRADEALEAVLLECLAEYQVSVPEIGTYTAKVPPLVVLTSNNTRDLSAALKRRCLHLFLDYPDAGRELEILRSKKTGLSDAAAHTLVDVVRKLRELRLRKSPSISETVDWARTLAVLGVEELSPEILAETANVVLKYERDLGRALRVLPDLIDPNRELPAELPHSHGHGHGHGHGHDHDGHAHHEDDGGRAARQAKDLPGRHDENYYGAPGSGPAQRTGSGQGSRAFEAFTRRRPV
ncbi:MULTISPECIES: AAA family ATPase [Amycolatopsis]|uniref:MoxR family ATPase n=1 Tax=Amycolatopsis dendrobii TaxID=2760662 RepID=A0A7W3ZDW2_9PSEU|nr:MULTISPECIES: MoxR family ATPase [Amycolatopsis]MBB1157422.1 MoxR family ATPase [Amycolatopsis dendrobii]UKD59181.1 MoxR family ATPase [Amycolatopsis sp. FU40]